LRLLIWVSEKFIFDIADACKAVKTTFRKKLIVILNGSVLIDVMEFYADEKYHLQVTKIAHIGYLYVEHET
jgi:hypothetical protein